MDSKTEIKITSDRTSIETIFRQDLALFDHTSHNFNGAVKLEGKPECVLYAKLCRFLSCNYTHPRNFRLNTYVELTATKLHTANNANVFYHCAVHSDVCRVHSPTNALLLI